MAQLMQPIDATKIDPTQGLPSLPVGKHPVIIVESDVKGTKAGDGGLVEFILSIFDGPAKGSTGAYRINLYNSNPQTVEIAHKQMSALCHVTGVYQLQNTQQLHNIPFMIDVGLQKGKENEEKGYTQVNRVYDIHGNEPGKQGQQQTSAQPAQAANAWGNGAAAPGGQQAPAQNPTPNWSGAPGNTSQPVPAAAPVNVWGQPAAAAPGVQAGNGGGGQSPPWARP